MFEQRKLQRNIENFDADMMASQLALHGMSETFEMQDSLIADFERRSYQLFQPNTSTRSVA